MKPKPPHNPPKNPLNLPEFRALVAQYLDRRDCRSCQCVSQDWFHDFTPFVWHTLDLSKDNDAFLKVTPEVVAKYGGFISHVVKITNHSDLVLLQHSAIKSLKLFEAKLWSTASVTYGLLLIDTIRRSQGTLRSVNIHGDPPVRDTLANMLESTVHIMHILDALSSPPPPLEDGTWDRCKNSLTALTLDRVRITRESFSSFLQRCTTLQDLSLHHVLFTNFQSSLNLFAGSKLRRLVAPLSQVWDLGLSSSDPCLLAHFPRLQRWHITSLALPIYASMDTIIKDVAKCQHLKDIRLGDGTWDVASDLVSTVFEDLVSCTLSTQIIASSTILGLVSHLNTLTSVIIVGNSSTKTADDAATVVRDSSTIFQDTMITKWLYMIPRLCLNLQLLSLEPIVCDIEAIEARPWVCKDLRELRLRVKDLDSAPLVHRSVKQLCDWRLAGTAAFLQPIDTDSIAIRVSRHMIKFKQLRVVWFGPFGDHNLPPSKV
ncbi:hypothetical protein EC991_006923 [Linnemannia zychae]|nr:hypothetical protein EC991_006923 [Linnemannia zychae]